MFLLKDQDFQLYVVNENGALDCMKPLKLDSRNAAEELNAKLGGEFVVIEMESVDARIKECQANAKAVKMTDEELDAYWDRPLNSILKEAGLR